MVNCFVPHCGHSADSPYSPCTNFRRFPSNKKLRQKWIDLIRRADRLPSEGSRVCICHFLGDDKLKTKVPSLFPWNVTKYFQYEWPEIRTRRKRKSILKKQCAVPTKVVETKVVFEVPDPVKEEVHDFNTVQDSQFFNDEKITTSLYVPESNVKLYVPETNKPLEKLDFCQLPNGGDIRIETSFNDAAVQTRLSFPPKHYVSHPAFYESQIYHLEKEIKELKYENTRLKMNSQNNRAVPTKAPTLKKL